MLIMDKTSRILSCLIGGLILLLVLICVVFLVDIVKPYKKGVCKLADDAVGTCVTVDKCESSDLMFDKNPECGDDVCCIRALNRKRPTLSQKRFNDVMSFSNHIAVERVGLKKISSRDRVLFQNNKKCGFLPQNRIINGTQSSPLQFKYFALLRYSTLSGSTVGFYCGGSLISDRYVLTAAHCIHASLIGVRLGEHDLSEKIDCPDGCVEALDIGIEKILIHKDFVKSFEGHDIALLRLSEKVDANYVAAKPICLPVDDVSKLNLTEVRDLTLMGFGRTETGNVSTVMMTADVPFVEFDECERFYEQVPQTSKGLHKRSQMCAGGKYIDSCNGDSGGPLVHIGDLPLNGFVRTRNFQYGIVSFGLTDCGGGPAVYTDVRQFIDWISDNVEEDKPAKLEQ